MVAMMGLEGELVRAAMVAVVASWGFEWVVVEMGLEGEMARAAEAMAVMGSGCLVLVVMDAVYVVVGWEVERLVAEREAQVVQMARCGNQVER